VVIWCFDIVHKNHPTPFSCIILIVLFVIGHPVCFIVLQNSPHPFLMCHLHCLVFCWSSNVFCHSSKLTPSPLTLVHCHLVFWWPPNVFHCTINPPPSHSFIILCFNGHLVYFIVLQNPPTLLLLFVMVLCFNQPLTCFIALQTQIPPFTCDHCHLIFLCFIWCFLLFCQIHLIPFVIIVVLFFLRTQIALLIVILVYEV
jgi:hypothetical protein